MNLGFARCAATLLVVVLLATACDSGDGENATDVRPSVKSGQIERSPDPKRSKAGEDQPEATPEPDVTPTEAPEEPADYSPDAPLATRPKPLAGQLTLAHDELKEAIAAWLESGDPPGKAPRAIALMALFQQRIYRSLTCDPKLGRATLEYIPPRLIRTVRNNFHAGRELSSGLSPVEPPVTFKTYAPGSPHVLLRFHTRSGRRFGIPWNILAAVNLVETRFGRILGPSSAGALGPMQFLPSTWERYGNGGNIMDPHDSIFAAARYLAASGGRTDIGGALYHYNPSDEYGNAVRLYANSMKRNPLNFYSFYYWQVFVRTTKGDKQLTGPGSTYTR